MTTPNKVKFRLSWMIPRNIRKINPWKINQIVQLLRDVISNDVWEGNQALQNEFIDSLNNLGIKSGGSLIDPNSGGARTYISQLLCLGLIYYNEDKGISYTLAGESLLNMEAPLPILQKQVLRMQFPSPYSLSSNVKIDPSLSVKPFLFLLKLIKDPDLGYLKTSEIIVPVLYGRDIGCFQKVKEKILKLRSGSDFKDIIDDVLELKTPRKDIKEWDLKAFDYYNDIANTLKNYLESTNLIFESEKKGCFIINSDFNVDIENELKSISDLIPSPESSIKFLRSYGAWNRKKDTRRISNKKERPDPEKNFILSQYAEYIGKNPLIQYPEEFVQFLKRDYGFKEDKIKATIDPFLSNGLDHFESEYLRLSVGGIKTATEFEKTTALIFNDVLKIPSTHIGQKKNIYTVGGYPDILISNNSEGGYIDTKASTSYQISSNDYSKMKATYIPHFKNVANSSIELKLIIYVAGGFDSNIGHKLQSMFSETKIVVSALSSRILINLARESKIPSPNNIWNSLKKNKILNISDFDLK